MALMRNALLWASHNRWLAEHLPRYRFVQRAVTRFMPGETLDDALGVARRLREHGITAIVTYLGENVSDGAEAESVRDHYLEALDRIHAERLDCHVSVKLTQLGLDVGEDLCRRNLEALIERAGQLGNFVPIDMEYSGYVDVTLDLFRQMRSRHDNVGLCLQAYLYRTDEDLRSLLPLEPMIRLVKGAYNEPPDIAYPKKADVDANYLELAGILLEATRQGRATLAVATHDEAIIEKMKAEIGENAELRRRVDFQMLYGIQAGLQRRLAADGYSMRVLISYGDAWYPWYMRRLAERPANVWFALRNLLRS